MPYLTISAMGRDRPGIVAEFTGLLFLQGCNLEDATMTQLRDQFAMLLVVRVPESARESLETALRQLATDLDLLMVTRVADEVTTRQPEPTREGYILRVHGADRPGIVHTVASALAERGLNITELNTRIIPGAGGPVYVMLLEVEAPDATAVSDLPEELQRLARNLNVEISFEALESEAM